MSNEERDEYIQWVIMWTGWKREVFDKKSNREVLELFERYNRLNRG